MSQKIKLIWDFKGDEAKEIAKHHVIHLNEFSAKEKTSNISSGIEVVNDMHCIAFLVVNEQDVIIVRDALKPHRGEIYE